MTNDEIERKEFMTWAVGAGCDLEVDRHGYFISEDTINCFDGWKARAALAAMRPVNQEMLEFGYLKEQTAEQLQEGGYWHSCSGCHEGGEYGGNNNNYHHSTLFNCRMGSGCSECGGLGVVWDNTDYEKYSREQAIASAELGKGE